VWRDPKVIYTLTLTLGQVAAFAALMLIVGRRVIPWILHYVAHTGSRELFRLAVLAIALGVAYGATELFGISFALGAFFAGMMLHESPLSQRAAEESLPLRDAFAVLFFVSVGMLFDPKILIREPVLVAATLFIILFGKSIAAFLIVRIFGHPTRTALTIAASLAQIGEFSFILASLGVASQILPPQGRDLILAGALLSILVNPLLFVALDRMSARQKSLGAPADAKAIEGSASTISDESAELPQSKLSGHTILVGYGRVGRVVGEGLLEQGRPLLVVEERAEALEQLEAGQTETIVANAVQEDVLKAANISTAHWLVVAIPDGFEAGQIVQQARKLSPGLEIIARAHSDAEVEYLKAVGANFTILGEQEIAFAMLDRIRRARNDGSAKPA
jgi:CPA2 family monovalent cation:H+ antiporter-2